MTSTTEAGVAEFTPSKECYLETTVRLLNGASAEQATLSLTQQVSAPNAELEQFITGAVNQPGAAAGSMERTNRVHGLDEPGEHFIARTVLIFTPIREIIRSAAKTHLA